MTPLAAAMLAAGEGLDPVLQLTCRDRNRLALTADLLGAHALGIRAVLCLSGDPMEVGRTGAKPVFDLDAVGLARLATDLGQGRALGGTPIDPPARFLVGVAEAPGADPSGGDRLAAKADAGATFAQTQPIYDLAQFAAWLDRLAARGLPDRVAILAGILPPTSAAQLERFATLPGWSVPDAVLARMRAARDQRSEGIALAAEMVQAVRTLPGVRGIHLMGLGHLRRPRGRPRRRPPAPPGPGLTRCLPEAVDDGDLLDALPPGIRGHDHVRPDAQASGHDHRIRQLEPASRPQFGGEPGDVGCEVDDPHLSGEAIDDLHRIPSHPQRAHQDLGIGERRDGERVPVPFDPDSLAGGLMDGVVAVERANHDRAVEQRYSHSPRRPSR